MKPATMILGLALATSFAVASGVRLAPVDARAAPLARASARRELTPSAYMPSLTTSLQTTLQSSTAGRMLAANCFQCHGTDGKSTSGIERLAGLGAAEIVNEMQSMRVEPIGNNIMKAHARGYTDAELILIADYFSRQ